MHKTQNKTHGTTNSNTKVNIRYFTQKLSTAQKDEVTLKRHQVELPILHKTKKILTTTVQKNDLRHQEELPILHKTKKS